MAAMTGLPSALLSLLLLAALAIACVASLVRCVSAVAKRWGNTPAALLVAGLLCGFLYLLVAL